MAATTRPVPTIRATRPHPAPPPLLVRRGRVGAWHAPCPDCGRVARCSKAWRETIKRCPACARTWRAGLVERPRQIVALRAEGLSFYRIGERLDLDMGTAWRLVNGKGDRAA